MNLHFYPGKTKVNINIDIFSFYSGYFDDYDRQDHSLTVTLSENEDVEKVIENIHNSVKDYGYLDPTKHIEQSVKRASEPAEGKYYSDHYKNNWRRILYLKQQPGIRGIQNPDAFSITN